MFLEFNIINLMLPELQVLKLKSKSFWYILNDFRPSLYCVSTP